MPYTDPNSEAAIASRKRRSDRSTEKRRTLRDAYLIEHPEFRPKIVTPESDNERRLRRAEYLRRDYKKPADFRRRNNSANLKCRFGISIEQRDAMIVAQGGLCLICKKPLDAEGLGGPAVDHNHESDMVRGIVHRVCNAAIGMFGDDPMLLRYAAEYLEGFLGN